jgi:uncharacterized protein
MMSNMGYRLRFLILSFCILLMGLRSFADDKIYPDKPSPARLVNDLAHMMNDGQVAQLEAKLEDFARTTSTQITIVTIKNLGGHDVEEYSVEVFNRWGLGQAGKNNGVLLLASSDDHKAWITVGKGLEGVLTDAKSGLIFRNELVPAFKAGDYYGGLSNASTAIIQVTKNEYKADGIQKQQHIPFTAIIILIIFVVFILKMFRGGGGSGGGGYRGSGLGNFATGMLLGNLLGGGGRDSGGWGGGDGGGGGFGGFGGGSSGGGGAGGSW